MSIEQRIQTCRLLEKMWAQEGYSEKLGLKDASTFHRKEFRKMDIPLGRSPISMPAQWDLLLQ